MKKYTILALVGAMLLFGCTDNDVELPAELSGTSTLDVQIASVGFANNSTTGRAARTSNASNNITWNHIFGGTASITFTNTSTVTPIDSTYTIDMVDFALNGISKTLINGNYDVVLTMTDNTPEDFVPVNATDSFTLSGDTSLVLDATTTYGMVLLDPYLVDANVTPVFSEGGTDHNLQQSQGYYYLYIPDGVTGTVILKESLFGQTVSKEITIESNTIDVLELVPGTSNAGITLQLEEFTIIYDEWDIDAPVNGITPSYGLFTDSGQTLGMAYSSDIVLGDLDGDGDLDAYIVNTGQPNHVWLNNGTGVFTNSGQSLGNESGIQASLGDFDGDGDLDVFVANYDQPNVIWINDGSANFSNSGQALGNSKSESASLGDLDGDGDLDAFVTNNNQPNKVWFNDGSGTFTDSGQNIQDIPRHGVDSDLADIDGDGDLDAIVINHNTLDKIWINDGSGNFSDSGQSLTNPDSVRVLFGDIDGDGDQDAFVVNTNNNANKVWFNDGNGNFTDSGQSIGNTKSKDVALADLDGDGDLDIYEVNFSDPDKVWFNDGSGNFSDSGQSLLNPSSIAVYAGDLDGDGDLDVYVVNADTNQLNRVWINN